MNHTAYSSVAALGMCILILLTSGFSVFTKGNWNTSDFVSSYLYALPIPIPLISRLIMPQRHPHSGFSVFLLQVCQEDANRPA